jgi:hypothetical protein
MEGFELILGNDVARDRIEPSVSMVVEVQEVPDPHVVLDPVGGAGPDELQILYPNSFPACAITRSMGKSDPHDFEEEVVAPEVDMEKEQVLGPVNREQLIIDQSADPELRKLIEHAYPFDEVETFAVGYYVDQGLLMRKWRNQEVPENETWQESHQVVIPRKHRKEILKIAHENPLSGHLGRAKTLDRIRGHFFWPNLQRDVQTFCSECHTCQVVGKPNQPIPVAPLHPIPPDGNPFDKIIIDCVGPLPKSKSGHEYVLTMMCATTRYPEAFPLRNITTRQIIPAMTKFFTTFGFPKTIQRTREPILCLGSSKRHLKLWASNTSWPVHTIQKVREHWNVSTRL